MKKKWPITTLQDDNITIFSLDMTLKRIEHYISFRKTPRTRSKSFKNLSDGKRWKNMLQFRELSVSIESPIGSKQHRKRWRGTKEIIADFPPEKSSNLKTCNAEKAYCKKDLIPIHILAIALSKKICIQFSAHRHRCPEWKQSQSKKGQWLHN